MNNQWQKSTTTTIVTVQQLPKEQQWVTAIGQQTNNNKWYRGNVG